MNEFIIPEHWTFTTLGEIGTTMIGLTYSPLDISKEGIPVLRSGNIQRGKIDLNDLVRVSKKIKPQLMIKEGDILICARNGSKSLVGKAAQIKSISEPTTFGAFMAVFRSEINNYVEIFLNSSLFRNQLEGVSTATINQITQNNLKQFTIPLPPLGEHERIVKKIETCFKKIDETEKLLKKVENLLVKYRESLLVKAFRGDLINQDPKEAPASKLLEKIREDRAKNSNGKKVQNVASISDDEKPFDLPKSWEWVRVYDACEEIEAGSTPEPKLLLDKGDVQFLKVYNLNFDGTLNESNKPVFFSQETNAKLLRRSVSKTGDVLLNIVGPPFGKISIIPKSSPVCNHNQAIVHFRVNKTLNNQFLAYWLQSGFMKHWMLRTSRRTSGQWNLSVNNCRAFLIPLPPLKEQERIVSKINSSLTSITNLTSSARTKEKLLKNFRDSILLKAFQGALVSRNAAEGTGHELLSMIQANKAEIIEKPVKMFLKKTKKIVKKKAKK